MKTVLIDNSLCVFTLKDEVNPVHVFKYIQTLGEAGIKYVELDFRAVMKLHKLPDNVGYIYRMIDPMFLQLCEIFKFDYLHLSLNDIKKGIETDVPVMLGLSAGEVYSPKVFSYAKNALKGNITGVRLRGSFPMLEYNEANRFIQSLKNQITVPIDICPMNGRKNALDTALKFSHAGIDTITLCTGQTEKFCSVEDYFFTLLSVFDDLPSNYNLHALCRAAVFHKLIFKNSTDPLPRIFKLLDQDTRTLCNVDTAERVRLRVKTKNLFLMRKSFVSVLRKMAKEEDIPEDIFACIEDAVKSFDASLFDDSVFDDKKTSFLN